MTAHQYLLDNGDDHDVINNNEDNNGYDNNFNNSNDNIVNNVGTF